MTTRQSQQQGLTFTGIWERNINRNKAKERALEIRRKYKCRAVLVNEDGGVSVYVDKKYNDIQHIERLEAKIRFIPNKKEALLKQLIELEEEEKAIAKKINELKKLYE